MLPDVAGCAKQLIRLLFSYRYWCNLLRERQCERVRGALLRFERAYCTSLVPFESWLRLF